VTQLGALDRAEITAWLTRVTQTIDRSLREPARGEALAMLRAEVDSTTASVPVPARRPPRDRGRRRRGRRHRPRR